MRFDHPDDHHTIGLEPSGAVWTDAAPDVSRPDPSGAIQVDAEHPARNRKVVGSNPTSGSTSSVSVALNVAHAPDRTSAQLFAALPPVALLGRWSC